MSMREKAARDKFRSDAKLLYGGNEIAIEQLFDLADERDALASAIVGCKESAYQMIDNHEQEDKELQAGLESKLTEAQRATNYWMAAKDYEETRAIKAENERNALQAELERYRNAVPDDVENLIGEYWDIAYTEGFQQIDQGDIAQEKLNEIKTLIGSLLEKQREKIEAAWIDGADDWRLKPRENSITMLRSKAKAYAEKIIGGNNE